ncbi:hypothetical protein BJV77DRAFT_964985 [Russula vinacea]|nr:hypothetical protein BJV77DRAFT_964985 [Russula vinacea]
MILATLAEFSYIPTTWNSTSNLTHWLLFLLVTLALTGGPTFYIAIVENQADDYMVRANADDGKKDRRRKEIVGRLGKEMDNLRDDVAMQLAACPETLPSYKLRLYPLSIERSALLAQLEVEERNSLESAEAAYELERECVEEEWKRGGGGSLALILGIAWFFISHCENAIWSHALGSGVWRRVAIVLYLALLCVLTHFFDNLCTLMWLYHLGAKFTKVTKWNKYD